MMLYRLAHHPSISVFLLIYAYVLDATKAFDRVQYCKLFRKLIDRNLHLVIYY